MKKRSYYVVLETNNKKVSNIIETYNDLDTVDGLTSEIMELDKQYKRYNSNVIILSWKRLNKKWWRR